MKKKSPIILYTYTQVIKHFIVKSLYFIIVLLITYKLQNRDSQPIPFITYFMYFISSIYLLFTSSISINLYNVIYKVLHL